MELIIENNVLKRIIGEGAELIIPDGVTEIGDHVCFYKTELEKLTIPEGVTVIDEDAFRGCSELRDIKLPESLEEIKKAHPEWMDFSFLNSAGGNQIQKPP
jgi:hypothetical protein